VSAKVAGNPGRVYTYAVTDDTHRVDDQVLIGIQRGEDDSDGGEEGRLSIEHAEHLRDALNQAINYAKR
jgi:hypothetical protein